MSVPHTTALLYQVNRWLNDRTADTADEALVRRFAQSRDEQAFAALLARHGPMVLGVCRRLLGNPAEVEDAFQATFLVFARRASAIAKGQSVGPWLHGVAARVSQRMRNQATRRVVLPVRRNSEEPQPDVAGWQEVCGLLDEELGRLSGRLRAPLVLCYLEGQTRDQAAQQLGMSLSTLKRRLDQGKDRLRRRLAARGVELPALLLATGVMTATVPTALAETTAQTVFTVPLAAASTPAMRLADQALRTMLLTKIKVAAVLLAACVMLAAATVGVLHAGSTTELPPATGPKVETPRPAEPAPLKDLFGDTVTSGAEVRLGSVRARHGDDALFVAFIDGGKELLTAGLDGAIVVWDAETGQERRRLGKFPVYRGVGSMMLGRGGASMQYVPPAGRTTFALSPDHKILAVADRNGSVQLWDVNTGKEHPAFKTEEEKGPTIGYSVGLTFTADGKSLLVKRPDQVLVEWDWATGKERRRFGEASKGRTMFGIFGGADSLAVSPDGKLLAASQFAFEGNKLHNSLRLWDLTAGKEIRTLSEDLQMGVASVAFAPDGKKIAWAENHWVIHIWDVVAEKELPAIQHEAYNQSLALTFAPDSTMLAAKQLDETITLWDVKTGKARTRLGSPMSGPHPERDFTMQHLLAPGYATFAPDGKTLAAVGASHVVRLWSVEAGKEQVLGGGHQGAVTGAAITPDGKSVVSRGLDSVIRRWELATGKEGKATYLADADSLAALSVDGRLAAYGAADGMVRVWDLEANQLVASAKAPATPGDFLGIGPGRGLSFAHDGKTFALLGWDEKVSLYETATGNRLTVLQRSEEEDAVKFGVEDAPRSDGAEIAFAPGGVFLATAHRRVQHHKENAAGAAVYLWNLKTSRRVRNLELPDNPAAVRFSPDGRVLAVATEDGTVRVLEVLTGQEIMAFTGDRFRHGAAIAFAPGSRLLAVGGFPEPSIRLWDLFAGEEVGRLTAQQGAVQALAFTPDGKALVTGGGNTTLLRWNVAANVKPWGPAGALTAAEAARSWADLANNDAAKTFKAVHALAGAPDQALPLLRESLKPAIGPEPERLKALLNDLGSGTLERRQQAADELERLADLAVPALQRLLEEKPSLELRQRVDTLLAQTQGGVTPSPERLQAMRAVMVLERLATPEAREMLQKLTGGAPGARLTSEARAALDRIAAPEKVR